MLREDAGLVERGGRGRDVAHAAVVQDVVDPFAHEQVELGHHGLDGLLVGDELETARARCSAAAAMRCRSARSSTIRSSSRTVFCIWAWIRRSSDLRTLSGTSVAERTQVLGQSEIVQGGLGLVRGDLVAGRLEPLLDVADELLAGDVLFSVARLERGGALRWAAAVGTGCRGGRDDRDAGAGLAGRRVRAAAAAAGRRGRAGRVGAAGGWPASWMATRSRLSRAALLSFSPRVASALPGSSWRAFWKNVWAMALAPWASACLPQVVQLGRQRWAVVAECHDAGQQHATQRQ